jgi:hypothetical protein
MRRIAGRTGIMALAALLIGCTAYRSVWVHTEQGAPCFDACRDRGGRAEDVVSCVAACPGAIEIEYECQPKQTRCVEEKYVSAAGTAGAVIYVAVGVVVGLIAVALRFKGFH